MKKRENKLLYTEFSVVWTIQNTIHGKGGAEFPEYEWSFTTIQLGDDPLDQACPQRGKPFVI